MRNNGQLNGHIKFIFQSAGVAILIKNNVQYTVNQVISDKNGRYIILDILIESFRISLLNLYGPNSDSPEFFDNLKEQLERFPGSVIMAGDWNVVQDYLLDTYNYKKDNNIKSHNSILELKVNLDLNDPWRILNPDRRQYTWRLKNQTKQSRLDYFLVSDDILALVKTCNIGISYRSDHSVISLEISFQQMKRGPGYWKFNSSLLYDNQYTQLVKNIISETVEEYHKSGNNRQDMIFSINDQLLFEILKMKIRSASISYAIKRKRNRIEHEKYLEREILKLESIPSTLTDNNIKLLQDKKLELENLRTEKIKGIIFRCKAKWYEDGEKNTEYFLNLEKRNYTNKNISEIYNDENLLQTDNEDILQVCSEFYKNLYSSKYDQNSKEKLNSFTKVDIKLSETEKESCEGPISFEECTKALNNMKNGKSPGSDGFTVEFYKYFWKDIGIYVCRSINYAYQSENFSDFQKQGIITCIPKEGRDRRYLKNWRPITLLNVDRKIASSVIAFRMKNVLSKIISESQTGFLKGRFIGENTRIIYDIMNYCEKKEIPGLLLTIDFEKAFDTVEWEFINKALETFNFGKSFRKWINLFLYNSSSAIINLGYLSDFFKCQRGCRQGDPISPYLFIVCVELLSNAVKRNKEIKGVKINNQEYSIFQYADDTNFTLNGSEKSLNEVMKTLDDFAFCSGLRINIDKCTATWIGSKINSNEKLCPHIPLKWSKEPFKILGIIFSTDLQKMCSLNFEKQLGKTRRIIFSWSNRLLTINGKITIIKSQILPLFVQLFIALPNPDNNFFKQLNTMLYKFIWNGKRDKIKRTVLINDYKDGGLKMIDPLSFCRYLKVTWIKRLITSDGLWQTLSKEILRDFGSLVIFSFKKTQLFKISKCIQNLFWKDVICSYALLKKSEFENVKQFIESSILNFIPPKIIKQFLPWQEKGLKLVRDLLTPHGMVKRFTSIKNEYNLNGNYLLYFKILSYMPKYWVSRIREHTGILTLENSNNDNIIKRMQNLKSCKFIYNLFIKSIQSCTAHIANKWSQKLNINITENHLLKCFEIIRQISQDIKTQNFQFKLIHRILTTNTYLYMCGIQTDNRCSFCANEPESLEHIFFYCPHSNKLWKLFETWLETKTGSVINLNISDVLLGNPRLSILINHLLVILKRYIYNCKYQTKIPKFMEALSFIKFYRAIEKYNLINDEDLFTQKWGILPL
jgi:exonuclease III